MRLAGGFLAGSAPALPLEAFYYAFPVAAGDMIVRFVLSEELALFFALVLACLTGVMLGNSLSFGIYAHVVIMCGHDDYFVFFVCTF